MVHAMRVWRFGSSVASSQAGPCGDLSGRERKAERLSARDLKTLVDALWLHRIVVLLSWTSPALP